MKFFLLILLFPVTGVNFFAQTGNRLAKNQLVIIANNHTGPLISKDIYGHFSEHLGRCIYDGIWVGPDSKIPNTDGIRNDVLFALREIKIPNLRWPGGCFADRYHWRDGIGPKEKRLSIVNYDWGDVTEDNSFGTHEYMKLVELLGCDAFISGNLGSGTVREMAEWLEYLTSDSDGPMTKLRKENGRENPWKVKFFGIGNESWGCGGLMESGYYANKLRNYSYFLHNYGDNFPYRVAVGPNGDDYEWTEIMMKDEWTRKAFHGLSLHYYSFVHVDGRLGSAVDFTEKEWFLTMKENLRVDEIIKGHKAVMDRYDPGKKKGLVVDEWGNWFNVEPGTNPRFLYQKNTLRDAITAAIHLNIFNQHADRVRAANLAQVVNVLQAVILTEGEKMILTPTYHVFKMFRIHQDARLLHTNLICEEYTFDNQFVPAISASASVDKEGKIHITMANLNPIKPITITCHVIGENYSTVSGQILTAGEMAALNSFEQPEMVNPAVFQGFIFKNGILTVHMPSKSVIALELMK